MRDIPGVRALGAILRSSGIPLEPCAHEQAHGACQRRGTAGPVGEEAINECSLAGLERPEQVEPEPRAIEASHQPTRCARSSLARSRPSIPDFRLAGRFFVSLPPVCDMLLGAGRATDHQRPNLMDPSGHRRWGAHPALVLWLLSRP